MALPEVLTNARIYYGEEATELISIGEVTPPDLESESVDLKGFGMLGTSKVPLIGHFGDLSLGIKFNMWNPKMTVFLKPLHHKVTVMVAVQVIDLTTRIEQIQQIRIDVVGACTKTSFGSIKIGEPTDSSIEMNLTRYKITTDGKPTFLLDKFTSQFEVNGEDQLATINSAIGK